MNWLKREFSSWSATHWMFDMGLTAIMTSCLGYIFSLPWHGTLIIGVSTLITVTSGIGVLLHHRKEAQDRDDSQRRVADKSRRVGGAIELIQKMISEGEGVKSREDAMRWADNCGVTIREVFSEEAEDHFRRVIANLPDASSDPMVIVDQAKRHLVAKCARIHEGEIRTGYTPR